MFRAALLPLLVAVCLTGCAAPSAVVQVPIPVLSQTNVSPTLPTRPDLSISRINSQTNDADVIRLYRETLEQLASYAEQLETLLAAWGDK